jgi:hypothetical protein
MAGLRNTRPVVWLSLIWQVETPAEGGFGGQHTSAPPLPSPRRAREMMSAKLAPPPRLQPGEGSWPRVRQAQSVLVHCGGAAPAWVVVPARDPWSRVLPSNGVARRCWCSSERVFQFAAAYQTLGVVSLSLTHALSLSGGGGDSMSCHAEARLVVANQGEDQALCVKANTPTSAGEVLTRAVS